MPRLPLALAATALVPAVRTRGKVVLRGGTSKVTATLKRGRYVFFCSVAGHERAGMKGVLTVG